MKVSFCESQVVSCSALAQMGELREDTVRMRQYGPQVLSALDAEYEVWRVGGRSYIFQQTDAFVVASEAVLQ